MLKEYYGLCRVLPRNAHLGQVKTLLKRHTLTEVTRIILVVPSFNTSDTILQIFQPICIEVTVYQCSTHLF